MYMYCVCSENSPANLRPATFPPWVALPMTGAVLNSHEKQNKKKQLKLYCQVSEDLNGRFNPKMYPHHLL